MRSTIDGVRRDTLPLRALLCASFLVAAATAQVPINPVLLPTSGWLPGSYVTSGTCPPFVFLELPVPGSGFSNFGTDVQDEFDLGDAGRRLMFMDPARSQPEVLFPRAVHVGAGSLLGSGVTLGNGSVHEPSVYHHADSGQYWVFFSYAEDLVSRNVARPCELYAMNVTPAVDAPATFNPDTLPVFQVTFSPTTVAGWEAEAFNPTLTAQQFWAYGKQTHFATNSGACVVDEESGPTLYWASNRRRADGFGMHAGELRFAIDPAGTPPYDWKVSMAAEREIQQFGTTSLIGFFPTPRGAGGSYRSSTESTGQWGIFEFNSDEAFWTTASGYFNGTNISDHNGTTVATTADPAESLLAISRYYLNNNESFGSIMMIPYADIGLNQDPLVGGKYGSVSQKNSWNLFPNIDPNKDDPSTVGKFATPAAGRLRANPSLPAGDDNVELFLTYSSECSNNRNGACSAVAYHAELVVVTDVSSPIYPDPAFSGQSTYANPAYNDSSLGLSRVLRHPSRHAFSMKPILTSTERFGFKHRNIEPLIGESRISTPPALAGMPVAQVKAGPIYVTDVRPLAQRVGSSGKYDPTTEVRNGNTDSMSLRITTLTKNVDPSTLTASDIWGIRIFITDPKVRRRYYTSANRRIETGSGWSYLHHNGGGAPFSHGDAFEFERYRHLSDVPAAADGSISFLLPADVPVKFHLLHADGTTLAAHRNHHSFAPGQVDQRCWGCHEHTGSASNPSGTQAFQPTYVPFDTVTKTGKLAYDAAGNRRFTTYAQPTLDVPEFRADIRPLLTTHCGTCHDSAANPGGSGIGKFDMGDTTGLVPDQHEVDQDMAIWTWLHDQRYINRRVNAAKSPLAWHFWGVQADTDVRLDGERNVDYKGTSSGGYQSRYWITTTHASQPSGSVHPGVTKDLAYKVIEWIDAGAPIDHDTANDGGINHDNFQIGLSAKLTGFMSNQVTIGFWDAFANVSTIDVTAMGGTTSFSGFTGNGTVTYTLPGGMGLDDVVAIEAIDANDNHSKLEKTLAQLYHESEPGRGAARMSASAVVANPGQSVTYTVTAPTVPNAPFYFLMSAGVYPGWDTSGLGLSLFRLQNYDGYMAASVAAGAVGTLNANGDGSYTLAIPLGTAPDDLYCAALMPAASGWAKSNLVRLRIE